MTTKTFFNSFVSQAFLLILILLCCDVNVFGQAEERTDPGDQVTNSINDNVYRNARLSLGGQAPAGLPGDTRLHVNGRFSQEFSGTIGGTASNDAWSSLGESFVPGGSNTTLYGLINQAGATGFISGVKNGEQGVVAWSGTNKRLDFDWIDGNAANQTRMSILSNGTIIMGATTANFNDRLKVVPQSNGRGIGVYSPYGNTHLPWSNGNSYIGGKEIILRTGGSSASNERMRVTGAGNVAIGATNANGYKFFVNGTTGCSLGFWSGSDKRYKKDIQKIDSALDKVRALDGVTYQFKKQTVNDLDFSKAKKGNHLGFLAQDLEKVFPELVRKDEAGYYAVNYDGLIPVLVEALKEQDKQVEAQATTILEQSTQIEEQATTISEQRTEINELTERLDHLENLVNDLLAVESQKQDVDNTIISNTALLKQNAPNPANGETFIEYALPSNLPSASLVIYDLSGREMNTYPISGKGNIQFNTSNLESGTYIYAIVANGKSIAQQKMIVQK